MTWLLGSLPGYSFSLYSIPTLATMVAVFLLAVLVIVRERTSRVSLWFAALALSGGVWLGAFSAVYSATAPAVAISWLKVAYLGIPCIAASTYAFTLTVLGLAPRYTRWVWLSWLGAALFMVAAWGSDWLIAGVYRYWWGYYPRFGPVGVLLTIYICSLLLISLAHFTRAHHLAPPGPRRRRLGALRLAFAAGSLAAVDFLPVYGVPLYPFGYLAILGFIVLAARAIWIYRLVDITPAFAAQQILDTMTDALIVVDPQGVVRLANAATCTLLACDKDALLGRPLAQMLDMAPLLALDAPWLAAGALRDHELAYRVPGAADRILSLSASTMRDPAGDLVAIVCIARDITPQKQAAGEIRRLNDTLERRVVERTAQLEAANHELQAEIAERRQREAQLHYLAGHDPLTGLANRRALEHALDRVLAPGRPGAESSLLFLDLDNFKLVNDTLGHAAGDQLLIRLTQLLTAHLRDGDLLARVGGDEFAVLLEGATRADAWALAERLRRAVAEFRFLVRGRSFDLGLSIGVVPIDGRLDAQTVLAHGDIAMYTAKEQGRNRVVLYRPDEGSLDRLREGNQWVRRIKDALRDDRLLLFYQPVVRLADGTVDHYEALLRLQGTQGMLRLPGAFLPAAERFGLFPLLDRWVVEHAVAALRAHPDVALFVNLSRPSLLDDELLDFTAQTLAAAQVAPARLGLEVSEPAIVHDLGRAGRWIGRAKELGCRVALDDFGVGFTSFAYLRRLPVDLIKIDGSFVHTLAEDPGNRQIIQALHTLSRSLGKETVAEFVETAAIRAILLEIGVPYGQGYLFGKPARTLAPAPAPAAVGAPAE